MQDYETGASWILKQLTTAIEEYGDDVCSQLSAIFIQL